MGRGIAIALAVVGLAIAAGPAHAQSGEQKSAVTYVEFKPADAKAGSRVLDDLAARAGNSAGVIRFDVLGQVGHRNHFALVASWSSAQTYQAFKDSPATQAIVARLTPLLSAPLDERPGDLLAGSIAPSNGRAAAGQLVVITHLDIIPTFADQVRPLLNQYVADSAGDRGVQTVAMLSWTPTTNHFQLLQVFADRKAFDAHVSAQHTVDYRTNLQPSIGSPYDARVYRVKRAAGTRPARHAASQARQRAARAASRHRR